MTKAQLLKDTIDYYSVNPKQRRCLNKERACVYSPITAKKVGKSEGCAIGRLLLPEDALLFDEGRTEGDQSSISYIFANYPEMRNRVPAKIRKLGTNFLTHLQNLHDSNSNWNDEGLSREGKETVNWMIKHHKIRSMKPY